MTGPDLLITMRSSPYGTSNAKEALDLALASAAFDQNVALLFAGEGVLQLLPEQDGKQIKSKNLHQMLKVLPMYGIEDIWVSEKDLERLLPYRFGEDLPTAPANENAIKALYQSAKTVIQF